MFSQESITYDKVLEQPIEFGVGLKTLPTKGNLVYEYNPFRNYRLTETGYLYKNRLYSPKELLLELEAYYVVTTNGVKKLASSGGIKVSENDTEEFCLQLIDNNENWLSTGLIPTTEDDPTLVEPGELTDFETSELQFDLNHPVDILPQYSYDGSVNLIINDGKNKPRLINSRFSALGRNLYLIVDRRGNNDTNIYDLGSLFDIDTSLYKRVIEIPRVKFIEACEGGKMPVGNYHFYFRYTDADGNETDFVAESGLISLFIGTTPTSIRSGFALEDSHKMIRLLLSNIDSSYLYVLVYYTRSSSDIYESAIPEAYKIQEKFLVNNLLNCEIIITGYEDVRLVPLEDINPKYLIADSIETLASCLNMLFIGNILRPEVPYKELEDLSLRFLPRVEATEYPLKLDLDYNPATPALGYYDPKFIYNNVGYWNHEFYRFGIVYIMSDNSLSSVFNVRGINDLKDTDNGYSSISMWTELEDGTRERNYITVEEESYKIVTEEETQNANSYENAKGVVSLNMPPSDTLLVYSINFDVDPEVILYIKDKLNIKGFFFVRQKRIPTILCLAYTIGIDKQSNTPILPTGPHSYTAERFLTDELLLENSFEDRLYIFDKPAKVRTEAAICPEYDVDSPYLNTLFAGDDFAIAESDTLPKDPYLLRDGRNFYFGETVAGEPKNIGNVKIIGVEDNVKLVAINDNLFSGRAGEAEEPFRFEYLEKENKITAANNLLRGSYGPYLGITGYKYSGKLIDIKIPGFHSINKSDLFKIRYADKTSFLAISERIDLKHLNEWFEGKDGVLTLRDSLHRGDCYICLFTHRLNRNFQDPSAPTNDVIVDPKCWEENYEVVDNVVNKENFDKINLGDLNAIKLGMWVTITVRSTKNLNIRAVDDSIVDETALTGHPRGFFPYFPINAEGSYKTPEALCYNKGFEKSMSERWNFEVQEIPAFKNDFTNRIAYSDVLVNDAYKNGFRVFLGKHYRDYPKTYGQITKLISMQNSLLCIFEHGIAAISVNERALAGEGSSGYVYINTSKVLPETPKMISDTYGSQWKDSIIKTPRGVYGVDTVAKKIWRTDGTNFECISDFRVLEFLNQNISLTERELEPIIGIRNVKAHYNKFKADVMFTFYDNLYGFEEKVWNLCYNEHFRNGQGQWITFYSWVPSYSENIYNLYFSFDRNTSKWITKLGVSKHGNKFSDGVTLEENVIPSTGTWETTLHLDNRTLPTGEGVYCDIDYELVRDNYRNDKLFRIYKVQEKCLDEEGNPILDKDGKETYRDVLDAEGKSIWKLTLAEGVTYDLLCSEYYVREYNDRLLDDLTDSELKEIWRSNLQTPLKIYKNDKGRRVNLLTRDKDRRVEGDKVVRLLNIRAKIKVFHDGEGNISLKDSIASNLENRIFVDAGYYESVVAVIPKYNMLFLTTDFWKHGLAGIIDIADKIYPTYWYGKLHPFEFEFVVADLPGNHKIFNNLEIISNKAAPESFHYEIVGECYDFAKDKKNMYIRLEATKELYLYNGSDIIYDPNYKQLDNTPRELGYGKEDSEYYDKSTMFPLYYSRQDTINEIEDSYHLFGEKDRYQKSDPNFSWLSGAEIVRYENLDEYRIWNHSKAVDIKENGLIRGNMIYKEDVWDVQIAPLNFAQCNEKKSDWVGEYGATENKPQVPVVWNLFPIPEDLQNLSPDNRLNLPEDWTRNIISWKDFKTKWSEAKLKDKFMKVRVRYSGEDLAIITAIRTLYSISYG